MAPNQFKIKIETDSYKNETLLTDNKYLCKLGKSIGEVKVASWDTNYYPGGLYTEARTATVNHPLQGSGSARYDFTDSSQEILSLIAYQDFNPKSTHAGGSEHWNFELRAESLKKTLRNLPFHQVPKSAYIDIEIIECSTNTTLFKKRLCWMPQP
jgi:hypothetical protein